MTGKDPAIELWNNTFMLTHENVQFKLLQSFDASTVDSTWLNENARQSGYVYLRHALPSHTLQELNLVVRSACQDAGWIQDGKLDAQEHPDAITIRPDEPEAIKIQGIVQQSAAFSRLSQDADLLAILRAVIGAKPFSGWGNVCRIGVPGKPDWTTPAHQDGHYLTCSNPVWTAWIPLMNCPLELGPLAVAHESHVQGLLPHDDVGPRGLSISDPRQADWRAAHYQVGDVVVFSDKVIHRALPNRSNRSRISVDLRFSDIPVPGGT